MGAKNKDSTSIGDVLRERGKKPEVKDIGDVWRDQKRIREEDRLLKEKYKESKRQAKKLKQKIRLNQIGDTKDTVASVPEAAKKLAKKVNQIYSKSKASKKKKPLSKVVSRQKLISANGAVIISIFVALALGSFLFSRNNNDNQTATLGQSASSSKQTSVAQSEIPVVDETPFEMIFPAGKNKSNTEVVRVSPLDKVPAYAFVDDYQGAFLQISQQELPPEFVENPEEELANLATNFQATNVIEIDGKKIYHGYSDKNGEVQSLLFIRRDILVFIASDKKLTDDSWVSYLLSLK